MLTVAPTKLSLVLITALLLAQPQAYAAGTPDVKPKLKDQQKTDADGDNKVDRGDTVTYEAKVDNKTGTASANSVIYNATLDPNSTLVAGSIKVTPIAVNDTYSSLGNISLSVVAADGLLKNDFDPKDANTPTNAGMTVTPGVFATTDGNSVTVNADGSFTFNPAFGYLGIDSFTYTAVDSDAMVDTGTVTLDVSGKILFVDLAAAAGGDGSQGAPFNSLAPINAAGGVGDSDEPNDVIYLFNGNYTENFELEDGQVITGSGVALTAGSTTILPPGTPPSFAGNITLANANEIQGFAFNPATGTSISGNGKTGGIISASTINLTGATSAISLTNHLSNFTYNGSVSGTSSSSAVIVNGGNAIHNFNGDITLNGGRLVDVQNTTGGSLAVSGALASNGGSAINIMNNTGNPNFQFNGVTVTAGQGVAVNLTGNGASTVGFSGNFDITTANGSGLVADSGVLSLADVNTFTNQVNATGGAALDLSGVNVGTLGFDSLRSHNNTTVGIFLNQLSGNVTVLGNIDIPRAGGIGLRILGGTASYDFSGGTFTALNSGTQFPGGNSDLSIMGNALGAISFGDLVLGGNSIGFVVSISNVSNSVDFGNLDIKESSVGIAMNISNTTGNISFNSINIGTDSAVDTGVLINSPSGTINLGSGNIANKNSGSSGAGIRVEGGANVNYSGNITYNGAEQMFYAKGHSGTVTLSTGTLAATNGKGVHIENSSGTYNLNGPVTLNGGNARFRVISGSTGTVNIDNMIITNPTGRAFDVRASSANINYNGGSVTQNNATTALNIADNTGGTINIAPNMTFNTGTSNATNIANNTGTTVNISGQLDIDSTSGNGFSASGGGTFALTNANNTINTTTGQPINLNGVTIGAAGIDFSSATASGTVTADGVNLTGVTGGNFVLDNLTVNSSAAAIDGIEINGSSVNSIIGSATIDNTGGAGINLTGANGTVTFTSVNIDGTTGVGVQVTNNTNPVNINGGSIGSTNDPTDNAFDVNGGSGNITSAASIINQTNRAVDVTGRTAGTATFSGNISETGTGINVSSNSGGATIFSGASKTINTGANTAVNLTTNVGHTVSFTNGGLDLDVTSGVGFNATGGGTVVASGANNNINKTATGNAVNISGATIGAAGVNFQSVTQNVGVTAINLNNTGASGGFAITGAGSANSGGSLSNLTGEAILLTDTFTPSFNWMNISNITREAIKGVRVNGITVTNTTVNNAGSVDAANDDDLFGFVRDGNGDNGLFGTARFENLTLSNVHERAIDIVNEGSGSLDLDIINVSVNDNDDTHGEDAIRVQSEGSINTDLLISGGTYNNLELDAVAYFAQGTGMNNIEITNVTSTNGGGPDNLPNGGGIAIIGSNNSGTTFNIHNNNLTGVQGEGVQIIGLPGASQTLVMNGTIANNIISSDNADGIDLDFDGNVGGGSVINATIDVNGNTISFDDDGIGMDYRDTAGTANITVRNNTLSVIAGDDGVTTDSDDGVFIFSDDDIVGGSGNSTINMAILNNTFSGIAAADKNIVVEDIQNPSKSACFNISGNSSGIIELDFEAGSGGGSITQASTAALASANNSSIVNVVSLQPTFNGPCSNVPLP